MLAEIARETIPGVWHAHHWGTVVGEELIGELLVQARTLPSKKARLCAHPDVSEIEQQMVIVMAQGAHDHIHCHPTKREALVVLRGSADFRTYTDEGHLTSVLPIGPRTGTCLLSVTPGTWHHLTPHECDLVFLEFALGPFRPDSTIRAPWDPGSAAQP